MKLLWLKEIIGDAYTEDMDAAACQAIGKDFVARADFNTKNTRVKELEAQVGQLEEAAKGHAKQLEELKKSAGDNEELTRKIGELEQQNKADKAAFEKELATIRLTSPWMLSSPPPEPRTTPPSGLFWLTTSRMPRLRTAKWWPRSTMRASPWPLKSRP